MRSGAERGERLHRRVWDLLPWYANGTLGDSERRVVEMHLASCDPCRTELDLCRRLGIALERTPETDPAPHPAQLARVLARIDADEKEAGRHPLGRLRDLLAATPSAARWALAVQLGLVLLLAGVLLQTARHPESSEPSAPAFRTLSDPAASPSTAARGMAQIRIVFAPGTTEQEIRDLLLGIRGQIAGGPSPLGVYTVEVPAAPDPLSGVLARLRKHPQVSLAEPADGGTGR
jgi:anti-sigma factor RsiW